MFKLSLRYIILIALCLFLLLSLSFNKAEAEDNPFNFSNRDHQKVLQKDSVQVETILEEESYKSKVKKFFVNIPSAKETGSSDFQPKELTVKVSSIVVWTNNDIRTHFITSMKDNYPTSNPAEEITEEEEEEEDLEVEVESGKVEDAFFTSLYLKQSDTFTHSFNRPGKIRYFCFIHPMEMQGVIIVEE